MDKKNIKGKILPENMFAKSFDNTDGMCTSRMHKTNSPSKHDNESSSLDFGGRLRNIFSPKKRICSLCDSCKNNLEQNIYDERYFLSDNFRRPYSDNFDPALPLYKQECIISNLISSRQIIKISLDNKLKNYDKLEYEYSISKLNNPSSFVHIGNPLDRK